MKEIFRSPAFEGGSACFAAKSSGTSVRIITGGWDGTVRAFSFDATSSPSASSPSPEAAIIKVPFNDSATALAQLDGGLLLVGTEKGMIHFYDASSSPARLLGTYTQAHSDAVSVLVPHPSRPALIMSGGEDGTVAVHDISRPDEDSACLSVMNAGCPVRRAGFFGGGNWEGTWITTGSEGCQAWHWPGALRVCEYAGGIEAGGDARGALVAAAARVGRSDFAADYLLGCHFDGGRGSLMLLAGSHSGRLSYFELGAGGGASLVAESVENVSAGHRATLRDFAAATGGVLITGGEDGRICEWKPGKEVQEISSSSSAAGAPRGFQHKRKERKHGKSKKGSPY